MIPDKKQARAKAEGPKGKIEVEAADTILQQPHHVTIAGKDYEVAPPTPATLFLISKLVCYLPTMDRKTKDVLAEVLHKAKDCRPVTRIAAVLVLGAKRINEKRTVTITRRTAEPPKPANLWQRLLHREPQPRVVEHEHVMLELDWLSAQIAENMTPSEIYKFILTELGGLGIGDFFGLTVSLSAANLLTADKTSRTAHGE